MLVRHCDGPSLDIYTVYIYMIQMFDHNHNVHVEYMRTVCDANICRFCQGCGKPAFQAGWTQEWSRIGPAKG